MKKLTILFLILFSSILYAEENKYDSVMTLYKDNYFIGGNYEDQVKIQISAKFNILFPSQTGVYLGYTQLSNWVCYDKRDRFYTMYQPEVMYRFESKNNLLDNIEIPFVDYFQVSPINHCSTGVEDEGHRSINVYYGQLQLSAGDVYNVGINGKYFNYYSISPMNKDINDYKKNYEADIFFKVKSKTVEYLDKEELHFKFGGYTTNNDKGWYCIEAQFRIITSIIQPRLFIQYFNGYGEFMVDYNQKGEAVRIGLVF